MTDNTLPEAAANTAAYWARGGLIFQSSPLTRGPWNPAHQHAGPCIALVCGAIEQLAAPAGLTHIARLTANLLRPIPISDLMVQVSADYVGKSSGHYSARLLLCETDAQGRTFAGKELARFTALAQRETPQVLPVGLPGHPLPLAPRPAESSEPAQFPFADGQPGYAQLVEIREAHGKNFQGPCAVWFRLRHPVVAGAVPSPYQRVAVAADSGNGISAILNYKKDIFVNADLTINLLRRPVGEWICLDAQTFLGGAGGGLAQSRLLDEKGLVGHATQNLAVRLGD